TSPSSGNIRLVKMRNRVVLPAPSGPIMPNISPFSVSKLTPFRALTRPWDFLIFLATSVVILFSAYLTVHTYLNQTIIFDSHLHSINQVGSLITGLDCLWSKFGLI